MAWRVHVHRPKEKAIYIKDTGVGESTAPGDVVDFDTKSFVTQSPCASSEPLSGAKKLHHSTLVSSQLV